MQPGDGADELAQVAADALGLVDPRDAVAREERRGRAASARSAGPCACACGGRARSSGPVKMHWCAPSLQAVTQSWQPMHVFASIFATSLYARSSSPHSSVGAAPRAPRARARSSCRAQSRYSDEPVDHVLDDAVAVVHDGRAHLHARRAERDELGRVAPGRRCRRCRRWECPRRFVAREGRRPCAARWASPPGRSSRRSSRRSPTRGKGTMRSRSTPMRLLIVLMSERPSAPPRLRRLPRPRRCRRCSA